MKFLVLAEVFDGFGDFDDFSSVLRFLLYIFTNKKVNHSIAVLISNLK